MCQSKQKSQTSHYSRVIVFVALLAMTGCSHLHEWHLQKKVGPEHVQPAAAMPRDWSQFNGPHVIAAQNAIDDTQWWNVFNDPEITNIVAAANQNYLPLQAAKLRIQEQNYLQAIAVGNLFPQQQQAFAEYQRNQFSENGNSVGIVGIGNSFDLYRVGLNANWEIDIWGRLKRQIESAAANVQISMEDERDIHLCLMADVVGAYIEIRVIQQRLQITNDQLDSQKETVRLATARFDAGDSSRLDVSQAEATLATIEAMIPVMESELKVANNRLCLLLGVPTCDLFTPQNIGDIPFAPDSIVVGAPWDLLRRRPDIRRAEREIASQSALIGVAAADLFPAFSLRGQVSWEAFKLSDVFADGSFGGSIIPGVRWNILNYGRIKNNVNVQKTRLEQRIIDYRQTVLQANTEAQDALTIHIKKNEEVAAIKKAVDSTEEALETAITQYREGEVDLDRVNNLRKDLISQLDLYTAVRGEAALALVRVFKTMGGGWTAGDGIQSLPCGNVQPVMMNPEMPGSQSREFLETSSPIEFQSLPAGFVNTSPAEAVNGIVEPTHPSFPGWESEPAYITQDLPPIENPVNVQHGDPTSVPNGVSAHGQNWVPTIVPDRVPTKQWGPNQWAAKFREAERNLLGSPQNTTANSQLQLLGY